MKTFAREIEVRWSDCDPNGHVRHSAFYDYGAHLRIRFFAACGYDASRLRELDIGPILFKEECSFIREIRPDAAVSINLLRGEIAEDASRWVLYHEIYLHNDQKAAHITVRGAWMDLSRRKLTVPPVGLAEALRNLPAGEDFVYKKANKKR